MTSITRRSTTVRSFCTPELLNSGVSCADTPRRDGDALESVTLINNAGIATFGG